MFQKNCFGSSTNGVLNEIRIICYVNYVLEVLIC